MKSNIYIDVRGPQPMLIVGMCVTELLGADRSITVQDAITYNYYRNLTSANREVSE